MFLLKVLPILNGANVGVDGVAVAAFSWYLFLMLAIL